jgi:replicative DNA helicase
MDIMDVRWQLGKISGGQRRGRNGKWERFATDPLSVPSIMRGSMTATPMPNRRTRSVQCLPSATSLHTGAAVVRVLALLRQLAGCGATVVARQRQRRQR